MYKRQEEDRPGFHEMIKAEGQRMSRLVNDMLSLASADNQSWSMHFEKVSLDVYKRQAVIFLCPALLRILILLFQTAFFPAVLKAQL